MFVRRAVITGLGAVTPLGLDVHSSWEGLTHSRRGIDVIERFDPSGLRNETAGEVRGWNFEPAAFGLDSTPDRATQFLLTAASEAVGDAGLCGSAAGPSWEDPTRAGAVLATNFGGAESWERFVAGWLAQTPSADALEEATFDAALDHLCRLLDLRGPTAVLSIACASGSASIGAGLDMIRYDRADVMLCGGHDALAQSPLGGLSVLRTMTADDILPFSANRSGTLFGEGAGVLVIEELARAQARGARVYCEVLGSCQTNNAHHLTAPDPGGNGMIRVLAGALRDAGVQPAQIDYINAHGTGTQYHDPEETHAIKTVLGAHAHAIPVSSIKGAVGHLMGAAGAVEGVAVAKTIETGVVPPTINDGAASPDMDLDFVVNTSRACDVGYAASISAGIGGSNACVVFGRAPDSRGVGG